MTIKELIHELNLIQYYHDLGKTSRLTITHGRERFDIARVNLESISYGRDTPCEYTITLTTCKEIDK